MNSPYTSGIRADRMINRIESSEREPTHAPP